MLVVACTVFQSHSPQLNEIMYLLPGMDRLLTYHSDMESDEVHLSSLRRSCWRTGTDAG